MRDFIKALPLGLIGLHGCRSNDKREQQTPFQTSQTGRITRVSVMYQIGCRIPRPINRIIIGSFGVGVIYAFLIWTVPVIRENRANPGIDKLKNHLAADALFVLLRRSCCCGLEVRAAANPAQ